MHHTSGCRLQHSSKELTRDKFVRYGCVGAKVTSTLGAFLVQLQPLLSSSCRISECSCTLITAHPCCGTVTQIYTSTFNMLHQALDVNRKIDMQHLVVQFGCTGIRYDKWQRGRQATG